MPKLNSSELAEQYGYTAAFLNANPELKKIFAQAVKEEWSTDKFVAKLRGTKWFKTKSEDERAYLTLRYTDPAEAKSKLDQAKVRIRQMANQLGIVENASILAKINQAAYNVVAKGWDDTQLRNYLGQYIQFTGGQHQGEAGEHYDTLTSYLYAMGVSKPASWLDDAVKRITRGLATEQDFKDQIATLAKAQYSAFAKQIDGGQTVMDLAQPYLSSMSQILELPAGSISLTDPTVKKALSWTNPATAKKEIMPLWQYEKTLRDDPRWKQTKNAQDSLLQIGHQVLADFGVKY